jgi:type IV pilus assembly protein PilC
MTFKYKVVTPTGEQREGAIDAQNKDLAILALQRRGFIIVSIFSEDENKGLMGSIFDGVPLKDVVILSRQISTLFEAQVSALKAFSLLGSNAENKTLKKTLNHVVDDLQSGASISAALSKHPKVFSEFYINMVHAGEESGKLNQVFNYLADYLDRQYALVSKTRNALVYPAFVMGTFFIVMLLMFTVVIPNLSTMIVESGQDIPIYTKVIMAISQFIIDYGIFLLIGIIAVGIFLGIQLRTARGKAYLDQVKLQMPLFGNLFKKLYLARISDNLDTMISSGISIVRAIEITASVVDNHVYKEIMQKTEEAIKGGSSLSDAFSRYEEVPPILTQMVRVGEETGSLASILNTLAKFYKREVDDAVDTLVGLIEPIMIVSLGVGVGLLLVSVLVPIYNIASSIQ